MRGAIASAVALLVLTGCRQEMADQPRYDEYEPSDFFVGESSSRALPAGTVARGLLREDEHMFAGKSKGQIADTLPFAVTRQVLERGQERYEIFCTPCHDRLGTGQGIVVRRGFRRGPPSFHLDRLKTAPVGHFFDVTTNGFGAMADYSSEIAVQDRWAIAAYIRALQLSQSAAVTEMSEQDRSELEKVK